MLLLYDVGSTHYRKRPGEVRNRRLTAQESVSEPILAGQCQAECKRNLLSQAAEKYNNYHSAVPVTRGRPK